MSEAIAVSGIVLNSLICKSTFPIPQVLGMASNQRIGCSVVGTAVVLTWRYGEKSIIIWKVAFNCGNEAEVGSTLSNSFTTSSPKAVAAF